MEINLLLEILKALLMAISFYFSQKREKALIATLERYNQRLENLEKKIKEIP